MSGALPAREDSALATCDRESTVELDDRSSQSQDHACVRRASCSLHEIGDAESSVSEDDDVDFPMLVTDPRTRIFGSTNGDFRVGLTDLLGMRKMAKKTRAWTIGPEQALCFVDESESRLSSDQQNNGRRLLTGFIAPRGVERRISTMQQSSKSSDSAIDEGKDVEGSKIPGIVSPSLASSLDESVGAKASGNPARINKWCFDCFRRMKKGRPYGTGVDGPARSDTRESSPVSSRWKNAESYLAAAVNPGITRKDPERDVSLLDSPHSLGSQSEVSPIESASPSGSSLSQVQYLESKGKRKASDSPQRSVKNSSTSVVHDSDAPACQKYPTWLCQDGKLSVVFANDVIPGVYEIDIVAIIKLTTPDEWNKQVFFIPGLPRLAEVAGQLPMGEIEFTNQRLSTLSQVRIDVALLIDCSSKDPNIIVGKFKLTEQLALRIQTKQPIQTIEDFEFKTHWLGGLSWSRELEYRIRGLVRVTFNFEEIDVFADKVQLKFVIRNARVLPSVFKVPLGERHLKFHELPRNLPGFVDEEAPLTIQRELQDMHHDLDIHMEFPYEMGTVLHLPTLHGLAKRPNNEAVVLKLPQPPYSLDLVPSTPVRTWKTAQYKYNGQFHLRFDRVQMPGWVPPAVRDDPMVQFTELDRVVFNALKLPDGETVDPRAIGRQLEMHIRENKPDRNGGLVLSMAVDVQVSQQSEILVVDRGPWEADFAFTDKIIDGEGCDWRKTEDGMTLFKSEHMEPGQIVHVELNFLLIHESSTRTGYGRNERCCLHRQAAHLEVPLPRISGKMVLMARISTDLDQCDVEINEKQPQSVSRHSLSYHKQRTVHIPRLTKGYTLSFSCDRPSNALKGEEDPGDSSPVSQTKRPSGMVDHGTSTDEMPRSTAEDKPPEDSETVPKIAPERSDTADLQLETSERLAVAAEETATVKTQVEPIKPSKARTQNPVKRSFSWRQCVLLVFLLTCFCTFFQQGTHPETTISWHHSDILRDLYLGPNELLAALHDRIPQSQITAIGSWLGNRIPYPKQLTLNPSAAESTVEPEVVQEETSDQESRKDGEAVEELNDPRGRTVYSKESIAQVRDWIDCVLGWKGLAS